MTDNDDDIDDNDVMMMLIWWCDDNDDDVLFRKDARGSQGHGGMQRAYLNLQYV